VKRFTSPWRQRPPSLRREQGPGTRKATAKTAGTWHSDGESRRRATFGRPPRRTRLAASRRSKTRRGERPRFREPGPCIRTARADPEQHLAAQLAGRVWLDLPKGNNGIGPFAGRLEAVGCRLPGMVHKPHARRGDKPLAVPGLVNQARRWPWRVTAPLPYGRGSEKAPSRPCN